MWLSWGQAFVWNVRSTTYNNTVVKFVPAGRDVMRNASVLLQGLLDPTFAYSNYNQVPARPHGTKARHASRVHHRPGWSLVRTGRVPHPRARPAAQHTARARRSPCPALVARVARAAGHSIASGRECGEGRGASGGRRHAGRRRRGTDAAARRRRRSPAEPAAPDDWVLVRRGVPGSGQAMPGSGFGQTRQRYSGARRRLFRRAATQPDVSSSGAQLS